MSKGKTLVVVEIEPDGKYCGRCLRANIWWEECLAFGRPLQRAKSGKTRRCKECLENECELVDA